MLTSLPPEAKDALLITLVALFAVVVYWLTPRPPASPVLVV